MFFKKTKKLKLNNKGLSLIELICAIAILSIIGSMLSSVLSLSAQSYNRGITEVNVQQETQLLSNQISDLIIDSQGDVTFEDNILTVTQNDVEHQIIYKPDEKAVYYSITDIEPDLHIMAEGVTKFEVDTSNYKDNGNVLLDICIEKNSRKFANTYTVTSRNKDTDPKEIMASISSITELVLEPNQVYEISASVTGVENKDLEWQVALNKDESTKINSDGKISIGKNEKANMVYVTIKTREKDEFGDPKAQKFVKVYIRRVNEIQLSGFCSNGIDKKKGAEYTIYNLLAGQNLNPFYGNASDNNYVDPYGIDWLVYSPDPNLYDVTYKDNDKLVFELKRDMNQGEQISVTAKSKHAYGENKSEKAYEDIKDSWHLVSKFVYIKLNDGGMKRNTNEKQGLFTQEFDDLAINDYTKKYEYRFKPTDETEWSKWYQNITGNANDNMEINLRPDVTAAMIYNKDYDVQIRISIIDKDGNTVWPTSEESQSDYIIDATMHRVSVVFKSTLLGFTEAVNHGDSTVISVQKGNPFDLFEFSRAIGYEDNDIKNNLNYILEKEVDGEWKKVPSNEVSIQKGVSCKLKFETDNNVGKYRVKVISEDMDKFILDDSGEPIKLTEKEDFILYNESTGEGIFYFEVQ